MSDAKTSVGEFFQAGAALPPTSPSYIERPADAELLRQIMAGHYCYVLTSRQRGKSSLMSRTAEQLRQVGIASATIDLSLIGALATSEQWYLGLIDLLARALQLSIDPRAWWRRRAESGPVQRFTEFLHDVVLAEIDKPVVVFADEIDTTLKLDFRDDFFAVIRALYNARASEPTYNRLTFVLLGVARPTDLIRDRSRTPFNIGCAIDLQEFSRADAGPLEVGLERLYPGQARHILDRIFYWTGGHPYLTQKLCLTITESQPGPTSRAIVPWTAKRIDRLVQQLFLAADVRSEGNLQFVRDSVEAIPERRRLLRLYRRIYLGEQVAEDQRSLLQQRLRLIGLVRTKDGVLEISNRIYRHVFDQGWISASIPINWVRIASIGAVVLVLLALVATLLIVRQQQAQVLADQVAFYTKRFHASGDPDVKLFYLSELCARQQDAVARALFFEERQEQQSALFNGVKAKEAGANLVDVVGCLYPSVAQQGQPEQSSVVKAMSCALRRSEREDADRLSKQLGYAGACPAT